jgi:uncharacterized protein (DUF433 family)
MSQIELSPQLYHKVQEAATRYNQTPDRFVEDLLSQYLLPAHPYVDITQGTGQPRAVIKGTRVGVDVIVGYTQAGYTVQEIAADILPHLTPAQIYDALSYYEDHRVQIDEALNSNTPEMWQAQLEQRLGRQAAAKVLGQ